MGIKMLWTGLTIIMALHDRVPHSDVVGAIFMVIGLVLLYLDK